MSTYFYFIERYQELYPSILIKSIFFKEFEGRFIFDPSLPINLIKRKDLIPILGINKSHRYSLRDDTIITTGQTDICINHTIVEFQTIKYTGFTNIIGILGLPFKIDIINEARDFSKI